MKRETSWSWCCAAVWPKRSQTSRKARAFVWNQSAPRMLVDEQQQLVEQAAMRHALPEPRLVGGQHEQHLVDEELRIIGIARAAEAEQQVDLVDAGKIAGIGAAIDLAADAVGLVVGPHAEEEAVDVERWRRGARCSGSRRAGRPWRPRTARPPPGSTRRAGRCGRARRRSAGSSGCRACSRR